MSAHPKASLLREIAGEAEVNSEFWREFQHRIQNEWRTFHCWGELFDMVNSEEHSVRRRPKTVRVSGEVSEELVEAVREVNQENSELAITLARALLSLVEDSND